MPYAVIMAGGQGERFWPLTNPDFPKYRLKFEGKKSLLQNTYTRLGKLYRKSEIFVVTTREHVRFIREELPGLSKTNLIIEPHRNNTASAILLSTAWIGRRYGRESIVSFFPADHLIQKEALFCRTLRGAIHAAATADYLVTLGIRPEFPSTAYGYIEAGGRLPGQKTACRVKRFIEKPNFAKAKAYARHKNFYWNGGIFTWKAGVFLSALQAAAPQFYKKFSLNDIEKSYKVLPNISIDYVLLEKTTRIAVYPALMDWCDIGSWDRLYDKSPKIGGDNYLEGSAAVSDVRNSFILNHTGRPLIVLGLSDVVVANTAGGTLICRRGLSDQAALLAKSFK